MSPATALPSRRSLSAPSGVDLAAMRWVLEEHRAARSDQVEALLLMRADGTVDLSEVAVARAALDDIEAALRRLDDGSMGRAA